MREIFLNVPYKEKDEAKSLGARWNPDRKQWYYLSFNGQEDERFAKWRLPDIVPVSALSEEQKMLVAFAKEGKNVLVDACIGSGKTTTIQALCGEMPGKRILYLTYNTLLKVAAKEKITGRNTTVTNYHGYAFMCLKNAGFSVGVSDLIQVFLREKETLPQPEYDLLLIDEYQDIESEIAEMLFSIKEHNPGIQIIAVGDMMQKIYDKTTLYVPSFISEFLGEYVSMEFTQCFRINASHAAVLGDIWQKKICGVNDNCQVEHMDFKEAMNLLASRPCGDILCLGTRNGTMSHALNQLEQKYPDRFNKGTVYASITNEDRGERTLPDGNTAIFTTYDSSKGLERRYCFLFDFCEEYWYLRSETLGTKYTILRNIFLVAASRGKEHIIFVDGKKHKPLSPIVLKKPFFTRTDYSSVPFRMANMFSFKYKEDVEDCYKLLSVTEIPSEDTSVISVPGYDGMIDLSPCIGILQQASYFENYNIDHAIELAEASYDRVPIQMKEDAGLCDKVLYLTALETYQNRYLHQVRAPFVPEDALSDIHARLSERLAPDVPVEVDCSFTFRNSGRTYAVDGRADAVTEDADGEQTVWELKFVSELNHEHYLQCACYMLGRDIKKGVLWNVRSNKLYAISIPDKGAFLQAVICTVTKGAVGRTKKE